MFQACAAFHSGIKELSHTLQFSALHWRVCLILEHVCFSVRDWLWSSAEPWQCTSQSSVLICLIWILFFPFLSIEILWSGYKVGWHRAVDGRPWPTKLKIILPLKSCTAYNFWDSMGQVYCYIWRISFQSYEDCFELCI